jgi:hypothetical protein
VQLNWAEPEPGWIRSPPHTQNLEISALLSLLKKKHYD